MPPKKAHYCVVVVFNVQSVISRNINVNGLVSVIWSRDSAIRVYNRKEVMKHCNTFWTNNESIQFPSNTMQQHGHRRERVERQPLRQRVLHRSCCTEAHAWAFPYPELGKRVWSVLVWRRKEAGSWRKEEKYVKG